MKAAPFVYHRPRTLAEATALLGDLGDDAKVMAGGQSLLPMLAYRLLAPAHVVDIGAVADLSGHRIDDRHLVVQAGVRQRELERSTDVGLALPVLHEVIANIAHAQIRNRGTVCGSLAHADPAAELPTAMVALDATMVASSCHGERRIAAEDFFQFHLTSALQPDEILVEVEIPLAGPDTVGAFLEVSPRKGDFALVGAMAVVSFDGGTVRAGRVVCSGVGATPFRAGGAEAAIAGRALTDETLLDAQVATADGMAATDDVHATAAYRQHVAGVLVRRCLHRIRTERGAVHAR